ncbi:hypothetical protein CGCF245_v015653 [Colletotrichum fructicola]|nr:hypothetical protein CGCF245_v015653 [Colletotrichum fructicola]
MSPERLARLRRDEEYRGCALEAREIRRRLQTDETQAEIVRIESALQLESQVLASLAAEQNALVERHACRDGHRTRTMEALRAIVYDIRQ